MLHVKFHRRNEKNSKNSFSIDESKSDHNKPPLNESARF